MKKRILFIFLLTAMLVMAIGMGSYAWFTTTHEVTNNQISTQELQLMLNMYGNPDYDGDGVSDSETITLGDLIPSDYARNYLPDFQLFNVSQIPVKIQMDIIPASSSNARGEQAASLLDALQFSADITYNFMFDEAGTDPQQVYSKQIDFMALQPFLQEVNAFLDEACKMNTEDNVIGFKPHADDFDFKIYARLPGTAGNEYQGVTSTFTLKFIATQVENPGWTE